MPDTPITRRTALGGLAATVAGGGVVYGASRLDSESSSSLAPRFHRSSATTNLGIDLQGHPIMGSPDATVDLYYWTDYQCPFCKRFEENALPKLVENDVETGTVRIVFIEYPYLGEVSMTAAMVDRCVWRQVRDDSPRLYWPWHRAVFERQGSENSGWESQKDLLEIASDVDGVDATAVETCLRQRGGDIESAIERDLDRAPEFGVSGTPSFLLYNRETNSAGRMGGAQPYERFDEAISKIQNA